VLLWLGVLELPLLGTISPSFLWNEPLLHVLARLFDPNIGFGYLFDVDAMVNPSDVLMLIFDFLQVIGGGVSCLLIVKLICLVSFLIFVVSITFRRCSEIFAF